MSRLRLTRKKRLVVAVILGLVTLAVFTKETSLEVGQLLHGYDVYSCMLETTPNGGSQSPLVGSQRKTMMYSCIQSGCGGWGDRQKGIVSTYILSAMLDRHFRLKISYPCDLDLFLTSNKVNWKVAEEEVRERRVSTCHWINKPSVESIRRAIGTSNLDDVFPTDVTRMALNMEVVQYLRKHPSASRVEWMKGKTVPEIYHKALHDLFATQSTIQKELDTFRSLIPQGVKLACAQVRLGKHEGFQDSETINSIELYPVVRRFLTQYNDTEKFRILVTSDSERVLQTARKDFPEVLLTLPGEITHVDVDRGTKGCDGFRKAILDQYALSTCNILMISESGLAKVAAFMRGHDDELYLFSNGEVEPFKREDSFRNRLFW